MKRRGPRGKAACAKHASSKSLIQKELLDYVNFFPAFLFRLVDTLGCPVYISVTPDDGARLAALRSGCSRLR
ncbi:hypothetical protein, partial [Faunimonas pinastri]|uniref:hypothetical protein n=1 Tax=Faunimonas pinastri TaxID=1855383 RepID=UPI001EEA9795